MAARCSPRPPPPPPPWPPPVADPWQYQNIATPAELAVYERPRGCGRHFLWMPHCGIVDKTDPRRIPPCCEAHRCREGYARFNYVLKNRTRAYWMFSLALMAQAARLWRLLTWTELSEVACTCRQGRRTRLLALLRGRAMQATYYWRRLTLMEYCCTESAPVLEKIMWYHGVTHSGRCA